MLAGRYNLGESPHRDLPFRFARRPRRRRCGGPVLLRPPHQPGGARKFLRRQNIERPDMIVVAGGAKTLALPRNDFEKDLHSRAGAHVDTATSDQVRAGDEPLRLRDLNGWPRISRHREAEAEHHPGELHRAAALLTANFPNISVEPYFVRSAWCVGGVAGDVSFPGKTEKLEHHRENLSHSKCACRVRKNQIHSPMKDTKVHEGPHRRIPSVTHSGKIHFEGDRHVHVVKVFKDPCGWIRTSRSTSIPLSLRDQNARTASR